MLLFAVQPEKKMHAVIQWILGIFLISPPLIPELTNEIHHSKYYLLVKENSPKQKVILILFKILENTSVVKFKGSIFIKYLNWTWNIEEYEYSSSENVHCYYLLHSRFHAMCSYLRLPHGKKHKYFLILALMFI